MGQREGIGRLDQPLTACVALLGVGFGEGSLVIVRRMAERPRARVWMGQREGIGRLEQPLTACVALLGVGFGEGSLVIVRRLLALPDGRGSVQ